MGKGEHVKERYEAWEVQSGESKGHGNARILISPSPLPIPHFPFLPLFD